MADLLLVGLRQADRLQHLDGVADVARALLLVERTIGREQRVIGREEIDAADGGGARAFDRGVAIEALEIIVRAFLQALEQRAVVLIRESVTPVS
jgi:hypothetical protein